MARHETEMHRHRRELIALARVVMCSKDVPQELRDYARTTLANVGAFALTDHGLFADNRQLDLADRVDLTRK